MKVMNCHCVQIDSKQFEKQLTNKNENPLKHYRDLTTTFYTFEFGNVRMNAMNETPAEVDAMRKPSQT